MTAKVLQLRISPVEGPRIWAEVRSELVQRLLAMEILGDIDAPLIQAELSRVRSGLRAFIDRQDAITFEAWEASRGEHHG
jgi:hypothetical protein